MAVPKRFGVLRLIGTLMKVIAWIILAVAVLLAIFAGVASTAGVNLDALNLPPQYAPLVSSGGIFLAILVLLMGLIYFLAIYAAGENIHLRVAMEENTRLTAALLLRMHQESQVDADPTYPASGFGTDPFQGR